MAWRGVRGTSKYPSPRPARPRRLTGHANSDRDMEMTLDVVVRDPWAAALGCPTSRVDVWRGRVGVYCCLSGQEGTYLSSCVKGRLDSTTASFG